jgi:hypothetical protein
LIFFGGLIFLAAEYRSACTGSVAATGGSTLSLFGGLIFFAAEYRSAEAGSVAATGGGTLSLFGGLIFFAAEYRSADEITGSIIACCGVFVTTEALFFCKKGIFVASVAGTPVTAGTILSDQTPEAYVIAGSKTGVGSPFLLLLIKYTMPPVNTSKSISHNQANVAP